MLDAVTLHGDLADVRNQVSVLQSRLQKANETARHLQDENQFFRDRYALIKNELVSVQRNTIHLQQQLNSTSVALEDTQSKLSQYEVLNLMLEDKLHKALAAFEELSGEYARVQIALDERDAYCRAHHAALGSPPAINPADVPLPPPTPMSMSMSMGSPTAPAVPLDDAEAARRSRVQALVHRFSQISVREPVSPAIAAAAEGDDQAFAGKDSAYYSRAPLIEEPEHDDAAAAEPAYSDSVPSSTAANLSAPAAPERTRSPRPNLRVQIPANPDAQPIQQVAPPASAPAAGGGAATSRSTIDFMSLSMDEQFAALQSELNTFTPGKPDKVGPRQSIHELAAVSPSTPTRDLFTSRPTPVAAAAAVNARKIREEGVRQSFDILKALGSLERQLDMITLAQPDARLPQAPPRPGSPSSGNGSSPHVIPSRSSSRGPPGSPQLGAAVPSSPSTTRRRSSLGGVPMYFAADEDRYRESVGGVSDVASRSSRGWPTSARTSSDDSYASEMQAQQHQQQSQTGSWNGSSSLPPPVPAIPATASSTSPSTPHGSGFLDAPSWGSVRSHSSDAASITSQDSTGARSAGAAPPSPNGSEKRKKKVKRPPMVTGGLNLMHGGF
ncbi:hypothetical protein H9P43_000941 [Blastocladiella emersonii ATCC 22665]|nr:hypothetical protein H9P43_000941 [Blastocladiella emersonii ATCC 22665]